MASTAEQTKQAVDNAARSSGFRCVPVSWEDCTRGHTGFGGLSSVGPNISDVRLYEKSGQLLYTLRSENWNERLGYVNAADVALVTGNEQSVASDLTPTTLDQYLQNIGSKAAYAGIKVPALYDPSLDRIFGIRFQTVFLPVQHRFGAPASTNFTTEVYNYQTRSESDPKNLLLLATSQGVSVQPDAPGKQRLYYHSVDSNGLIHRYWLEAEKSDKQVGGSQVETTAEAAAAAARGKAVAVRLGPSAMGTRFNVQMLIQIPLKQKPQPQRQGNPFGGGFGGSGARGGGGFGCAAGGRGGGRGGGAAFGCAAPSMAYCAPGASADPFTSSGFAPQPQNHSLSLAHRPSGGFGFAPPPPRVGTSNAARVSRGEKHDTWGGVSLSSVERDPTQHGTITVTMYYTVANGVPSVEDVKRAVDDLNSLYAAVPSSRLSNCHEVTTASNKSVNPFGVPPPPPSPFVATTAATPIAVNPFEPGVSAMRRCPNNHALSKLTGGGDMEPKQGWVCDSCGVFTHAGPSAYNVKGYCCRWCDFDVCSKCHDSGPACANGHLLCPVKVQEPTAYHQCQDCNQTFVADRMGMMGCATCAKFCCRGCFCKRLSK